MTFDFKINYVIINFLNIEDFFDTSFFDASQLETICPALINKEPNFINII